VAANGGVATRSIARTLFPAGRARQGHQETLSDEGSLGES
jgi:hypothetical protein